jgi:hypothetical protein
MVMTHLIIPDYYLPEYLTQSPNQSLNQTLDSGFQVDHEASDFQQH